MNKDRTRSRAAWLDGRDRRRGRIFTAERAPACVQTLYRYVTNGCCVLRDEVRGPGDIRRLADGEQQACNCSPVDDRQNVPACFG